MRSQRRLVVGYVVVAAVTHAALGSLVWLWGSDDAVTCCVGRMLVLACWLVMLFVVESSEGKAYDSVRCVSVSYMGNTCSV